MKKIPVSLDKKEGFLNRHEKAMPKKNTVVKIVTKDIDGEHIYTCEWRPFNKVNYLVENMPSKGYLGTAKVIEGEFSGIGFHAWKQNNSEFVLYSIVNN